MKKWWLSHQAGFRHLKKTSKNIIPDISSNHTAVEFNVLPSELAGRRKLSNQELKELKKKRSKIEKYTSNDPDVSFFR